MSSRRISGLKRGVLAANNDGNIEAAPKRTKKKSNPKQAKEKSVISQNLFTCLVEEAGVTLSPKGNKIETDSVSFWQTLNKIIAARDDNINETIEAFVKALEESIENEQFLVACLMPTELTASLEDLGITASQASNSIQVHVSYICHL